MRVGLTVPGGSESLASSARDRGMTVTSKGKGRDLSLEFSASTEDEAMDRLNALAELVAKG